MEGLSEGTGRRVWVKRDGRVRMQEVQKTGIFFLSQLRRKGEGWLVKGEHERVTSLFFMKL